MAKAKITLKYENLADLNKVIDTIAVSGKALRQEIHTTAIQAMLWAQIHGDVTALTRLVYAFGGAKEKNSFIRAESFKAWVQHFCPVRWVKAGTEGGGKRDGFRMNKGRAKDGSDFLIREANDMPFWMYEKEISKSDLVMDVAKWLTRLSSLAAQMEKAIDEGKVPDVQIPFVKTMAHNVVSLYKAEEKASMSALIVKPVGGEPEGDSEDAHVAEKPAPVTEKAA